MKTCYFDEKLGVHVHVYDTLPSKKIHVCKCGDRVVSSEPRGCNYGSLVEYKNKGKSE